MALEYLKFRSARVCDECYALASDFYCRIDGPGNKSELNERGAILEKEMDSSSCSSAADAGSLTPSSFVGAFSYTLGKRKDRLPGRKERKNIPERLMEVLLAISFSSLHGNFPVRNLEVSWHPRDPGIELVSLKNRLLIAGASQRHWKSNEWILEPSDTTNVEEELVCFEGSSSL